MFRLPIDVTGLTLLAATMPEPVVDFATRLAKADENGEPLFSVQLVALGGDGAEVLTVKVPGEPVGLTVGGPVRVTGLVASPWSMAERSGISFRASRIEPATSPVSAPVAIAAPGKTASS